jgi:hypothetical protein
LSALRQVYFGSGAWSLKSNSVWDKVIESPVWSPGTDPTPQLGPSLMAALKASDVVEQIDISHVLTGLDAMMSPHNVENLPGVLNATTVPNEEWATWAGDVGSAAAMFTIGQTYAAPGTTLDPATSFSGYASDADLRGDTDAFAMRSGFNPGGSPASRLGQAIHLSGTLSEDIRQYYRMTSTVLGAARSSSAQRFVEAYGGVIAGGVLTNRPALIAALRPSVDEFARLFMGQELLSRGYLGSAPPRPGAPDPSTLIGPAVDTMTDRFVTWLERQLSVTPAAPSPAPPRSSPSARRCTHLRPPTR